MKVLTKIGKRFNIYGTWVYNCKKLPFLCWNTVTLCYGEKIRIEHKVNDRVTGFTLMEGKYITFSVEELQKYFVRRRDFPVKKIRKKTH